ncbi:AbiTii domain-containing protein [Streptomyces anulatus]|uniref:AbiTii domain-containing protein n=1 Tax=Streptomyces anulatus TaxID=1892 RepID=UPI0036BAC4AE
MNRQEEVLLLAEQLLADIELKRLAATDIVLKASRLGRLAGHDDLQTFLRYEREGYPSREVAGEWVTRAGRNRPEDKWFSAPLTQIEAVLESSQQAMEALKGGGNYSGDMVPIAAREHDQRIVKLSQSLTPCLTVRGAVLATIYSLVTEIYHELLFSQLQSTLFEQARVRVDGALAQASGSALDKIESVSDRLREGAPESVSQALTTCRRLIDSCADHVFQGREGDYVIGEQPLKVGNGHVLNRLQAYCHQQGISKSRHDRIRKTMAELYSRCSAGTHADVTIQEARFVFLQTYVLLGEVLTLRNEDVAPAQ